MGSLEHVRRPFQVSRLKGALKGEPLARETASKTDDAILSWPHNASSAPWSSQPSLQRSYQLGETPRARSLKPLLRAVLGVWVCVRAVKQASEKLEKARAVLYPSIGPGHYGAPSVEVRKTARITGNRSAFTSKFDRFNDKQSAMSASVRVKPHPHSYLPPRIQTQANSRHRSCARRSRHSHSRTAPVVPGTRSDSIVLGEVRVRSRDAGH